MACASATSAPLDCNSPPQNPLMADVTSSRSAHPVDGAGISASGIVGLVGRQAAVRDHRLVQAQHVDRRVVTATRQITSLGRVDQVSNMTTTSLLASSHLSRFVSLYIRLREGQISACTSGRRQERVAHQPTCLPRTFLARRSSPMPSRNCTKSASKSLAFTCAYADCHHVQSSL